MYAAKYATGRYFFWENDFYFNENYGCFADYEADVVP